MPNWVFNSLVVSGEQSALDKMVEQLNQPFEKHFPDSKFNQETKDFFTNECDCGDFFIKQFEI